jgi:hypothetical protein
MMHDIQRIASAVVRRVMEGRSLDTELAAALRAHSGVSAQQRAAIRDLCFGTLRWLGEIDAVLQVPLDKPHASACGACCASRSTSLPIRGLRRGGGKPCRARL